MVGSNDWSMGCLLASGPTDPADLARTLGTTPERTAASALSGDAQPSLSARAARSQRHGDLHPVRAAGVPGVEVALVEHDEPAGPLQHEPAPARDLGADEQGLPAVVGLDDHPVHGIHPGLLGE